MTDKIKKDTSIKGTDFGRAGYFSDSVKTTGIIKSSARLVTFIILTIIASIASILLISRGFSKTVYFGEICHPFRFKPATYSSS